jgi:nucleoside-diphosphate-sugar epimerase
MARPLRDGPLAQDERQHLNGHIRHGEAINVLRNQRILLTGGAGFIGGRLAQELVEENQVVIFDNGHRDSVSQTSLVKHANVTMIRGDVLDLDAVRRAAEGADYIVHLAAIAGVDTVLRMPVTTMQVNILGTYHVLEAARELGAGQVKRFVDFSTSEVFGVYAYKVREGDLTALGAVGEARWTYAVSKLATEHMAHNYHRQFGLPTVSIRPFNIYGPGQVGEGAIHRFIAQAIKGEDITIHNDGSQIRAWCYIDDMVNGILRTLERPEAVAQAFNIGNPRSVVTIHHLAHQVARLSSSRSRIIHKEWKEQDVELRIPDIAKARELLGFEPQVDLEEGLLRTIAWYRRSLQA